MRQITLSLDNLHVTSFQTSETGVMPEGFADETKKLSPCYSQCMSDCWPTDGPCCIND